MAMVELEKDLVVDIEAVSAMAVIMAAGGMTAAAAVVVMVLTGVAQLEALTMTVVPGLDLSVVVQTLDIVMVPVVVAVRILVVAGSGVDEVVLASVMLIAGAPILQHLQVISVLVEVMEIVLLTVLLMIVMIVVVIVGMTVVVIVGMTVVVIVGMTAVVMVVVLAAVQTFQLLLLLLLLVEVMAMVGMNLRAASEFVFLFQ